MSKIKSMTTIKKPVGAHPLVLNLNLLLNPNSANRNS
jgi:hypothetical protein